jgi:uncharacterized protein
MKDRIRGFALPFRLDPTSGRVAALGGDDKLRKNIVHILLTSVGERPMRRDYGGGLRQLVHDPNNDALRSIVQHRLGQTIEQFEPRVRVEEVLVEQEEATLFVTVQFTVRRTQQTQTVSVPLTSGR